MLPAEVWKMPPLRTINLHGSLLPQYRGAAPINHVIMNGETETGVTTFFIDEAIDTGKILFAEKMNIGSDEDAGSLHDQMKIVGAELVVKTLNAIAQGNISPMPQEQLSPSEAGLLKAAPKIHPADCVVDWENAAVCIFNKIRGLSPYPAAFTYLKHEKGTLRTLKIYQAKLADKDFPAATATGTIALSDNRKQCFVAAKDGWIELLELQIDGKKRMKVDEFLRGFDISPYNITS